MAETSPGSWSTHICEKRIKRDGILTVEDPPRPFPRGCKVFLSPAWTWGDEKKVQSCAGLVIVLPIIPMQRLHTSWLRFKMNMHTRNVYFWYIDVMSTSFNDAHNKVRVLCEPIKDVKLERWYCMDTQPSSHSQSGSSSSNDDVVEMCIGEFWNRHKRHSVLFYPKNQIPRSFIATVSENSASRRY